MPTDFLCPCRCSMPLPKNDFPAFEFPAPDPCFNELRMSWVDISLTEIKAPAGQPTHGFSAIFCLYRRPLPRSFPLFPCLIPYTSQKSTRHRRRMLLFQSAHAYIGNKRKLLHLIGTAMASTGLDPLTSTFFDLFSGSGVVARFTRKRGFGLSPTTGNRRTNQQMLHQSERAVYQYGKSYRQQVLD